MRTLELNEINAVSGAGAIATAFGDAGKDAGTAFTGIISGGSASSIGGAVGAGIGSAVEGGLNIAGKVGKGVSEDAPSLIGATGSAVGTVAADSIGAIGTAVGNAVGGIIKGFV